MACLWAVAERTGGQDQSAIVDRVGLPGDVSQATPLVGNRLVSLQRSGEIAPNRVDIRQAEKGVGDARLVLDLASNRECLIEVTFRCDGFPQLRLGDGPIVQDHGLLEPVAETAIRRQ